MGGEVYGINTPYEEGGEWCIHVSELWYQDYDYFREAIARPDIAIDEIIDGDFTDPGLGSFLVRRAVPEPATLLLLGPVLVGMVIVRKRKKV